MKIHVGIVFVILLLMSSCTQVDQSVATNKATADRINNEAWNSGNLDVLDDAVAADFVRHNPPSVDPPEVSGLDAFKEYITSVRTAYPDFHVEVHSRVAEGDLGAANWTVTGTNAESGIAIKVPGISISRFQDGKLAEEWVSWDTESLSDQLEADTETDQGDTDDED